MINLRTTHLKHGKLEKTSSMLKQLYCTVRQPLSNCKLSVVTTQYRQRSRLINDQEQQTPNILIPASVVGVNEFPLVDWHSPETL